MALQSRTDLVAFATSQFLSSSEHARLSEGTASVRTDTRPLDSPCAHHICALIQWSRQVHRLASQLQRHSGEAASVHLFTPCMQPAVASTLAEDTGARIVIHPRHERRLMQAVLALQDHARMNPHEPWSPFWAKHTVQMLCRWEVVSMTQARLVVYLDLDVEVLPAWSLRLLPRHRERAQSSIETSVNQVGNDWLHLLRCANASNWSLLSLPDHSSPVNGALLIVRPEQGLYEEGLEALRRAARAPWNASTGWDRVGRPREVVPAADHVWWRRRRHTRLVDEDDWGFVGAQKDQGLFFYIFRVRHRIGADLRLTHCARSEAGSAYYHYGSVGGVKPGPALQEWLRVRAHRRCYSKIVPHLARDGFVLRRTIGWARRTQAEVEALLRWQPRGAARTVDVQQDEILECAAALELGLRCVAESSGAKRTEQIRLPDGDCYTTRCVERQVTGMQVLDAVEDNSVFTRPLPLLRPAASMDAYVNAPRYPTASQKRQ